MSEQTKAQQLASFLITERNTMANRVNYYSAVAIALELRRLSEVEMRYQSASQQTHTGAQA